PSYLCASVSALRRCQGFVSTTATGRSARATSRSRASKKRCASSRGTSGSTSTTASGVSRYAHATRRSAPSGCRAVHRQSPGRTSRTSMAAEPIVGIDVGTTGVKAIAIDERGNVLARAEEGYPLSTPRPGWAEQDPEDWWQAAQRALVAV